MFLAFPTHTDARTLAYNYGLDPEELLQCNPWVRYLEADQRPLKGTVICLPAVDGPAWG